MVELIAADPWDGALPLSEGDVALSAMPEARTTGIAPFAGREDGVSTALREAFGLPFSGPNEHQSAGEVRLLWTGPGRALLIGAAPPDGLSDTAALTDLTDAEAAARLEGPAAEAVLARLVPLDLRPSAFPEGATARTLLGHMTATVTRLGPEAFELRVMRSMAGTLVHDLRRAMRHAAARA
ncbi:sarcosine oxidase subunit gamma [Wenxinia marina]|uniref:Sarcosine oxidase gamma subunit n=1 Tax=Wenxinia marina DSM 24838 TaxID=1123501 RepID=A0A0D0QBM0_9RHOB|nr:hypothetical protein [Wenxinia marina]KIQ68348.1 Sarcosine oxidase gamma subunit [Wenxinia marina DSM 24838]GGL72893.1 hypothetical protein GCM10011392_29410 [Wenxinia marina]